MVIIEYYPDLSFCNLPAALAVPAPDSDGLSFEEGAFAAPPGDADLRRSGSAFRLLPRLKPSLFDFDRVAEVSVVFSGTLGDTLPVVLVAVSKAATAVELLSTADLAEDNPLAGVFDDKEGRGGFSEGPPPKRSSSRV